ncbi:MAG: hypothetical protein ACT4OT_14005 [Acidobacteriota bacterium]
MQKKYNVGASLQCAEEKKDDERWSEDEQQQNYPKKQPLQSLAVPGWFGHTKLDISRSGRLR